MLLRVVLAAATVLAAGMVVLGASWAGRRVAPGIWQDGVTLARWFALWALLALGGAGASAQVPSWRARAVTVVPLLIWIAWQLRASALGPLAFGVYAVPTSFAWVAGTVAGDRLRRWHET